MAEAEGKSVLNLFAYTCGVGVAAALFLPGVPPVTGIVVGFLVQAVLGRG